MRVVGLHSDVLVATSRVWQTTCTIVRSGEECFVIDSPVFPDELEVLPAVLEHAGFALSGLLATHADWDHLLGRLAFPGAALGVAETTAARLTAEPGAAARELRAFDDEHYVDRPAPLSLGQVQALPVPGHCEIGDDRARAASRRRPHRRRHGDLDRLGARARLRRLHLAGRGPDALRRAARATRTSRRCGGWSRSSTRPRTSCPATAR